MSVCKKNFLDQVIHSILIDLRLMSPTPRPEQTCRVMQYNISIQRYEEMSSVDVVFTILETRQVTAP